MLQSSLKNGCNLKPNHIKALQFCSLVVHALLHSLQYMKQLKEVIFIYTLFVIYNKLHV